MKLRAVKIKPVAAALAVLVTVVAGAAPAGAALITKPVERVQSSAPFKCNQANEQYVLDSFRSTNNCGGIATKAGPGWVGAGWPGLVNGNYVYVTSKYMNGSERGTFSPTLSEAGWYEVWVSYRASSNRSRTVPFYVFTDYPAGDPDSYKIVVNEYAAPHRGGARWAKLGTFRFDEHTASRTPTSGYVQVRNGPGHSEAVDAAYFKHVGPAAISNLAATDGPFENDPNNPGTIISDRVRISWDPEDHVTKYQVYRDTVETFDEATATLLGEPTEATLDDVTGLANTTYYYFVRAVGITGKLSDVASDTGAWTDIP